MKEDFSKILRAIRLEKGLTQKQLGERCGIADPTIRKYESGKLNPKLETVAKLAKGLQIDISILLGSEKNMMEHNRKDREFIMETPETCEARQLDQLLHELLFMNDLGVFKMFYTPVRILKNGEATVVFWVDGTKTVVKPADGIAPNDYEAFTAALAKKIFGNNSALKKVIQRTTVIQEPKRKKKKADPVEAEPMILERMEEPNEADRD